MKSIQNLVFVILLICCSSKQFGFNKQQVLNAGKDMVQKVKEYLNPEVTIPKVKVEATIIATNPLIKKAIIVGNIDNITDSENKTLIDYEEGTIIPNQTVQVPIQEEVKEPQTQIPKQEQEMKEPQTQVPKEEEDRWHKL